MPPPPAPGPAEAAALRLALRWTWARGLQHQPQDPPPHAWAASVVRVPRRCGGTLGALAFDAPAPRGVVLFGHPGIGPAKGYFHRSDRIPFVHKLGLSALTFDYGGFGESDAACATHAHEWLDALESARRRWVGLPLHVWGVSLGGYFAHHALAMDAEGVESALFEQVTPDLTRYARAAGEPSLPVFRAFRTVAPHAAGWFPAISHAPHLRARRVLHVAGTRDHGIRVEESEALAAATHPPARLHVVEGARHLSAWRDGGAALRDLVAEHLLGEHAK